MMATFINNKFSKEEIAQRIVFTIAKKWQINEKELATRFDPLMMLLVDVIAQEMDAINKQWELSVEEMTNTIIQRFFPSYPIKDQLPHIVILQAKPNEAFTVLPAYFNFQWHYNDHIVNFTPIHDTKIFDIKQHSLWVNEKPFVQKSSLQSKNINVIRSLSLLCTSTNQMSNFDGLQLYFDTGTISEKAILLYALQYGKCSINGTPVELKIGYKKSSNSNSDFWTDIQNISYNLQYQQFITIVQNENCSPLTNDHFIWNHLNDKASNENNLSNAIYIQWDFPVLIEEKMLQQFNVYLNAFVGINRLQTVIQHKLDSYVNLVPLTIDQHLLFVDQIKSETEELYTNALATSEVALSDGTYLLKTSNFGKMSSDGLRNSIQDLKEQVNSSNAFFSAVSNDYISRNLQEMQRTVYRLEDKLRNAIPLKQQMQYLLLKPFKHNTFVSIDYWTFDNKYLDKIRIETSLQTKGSLIENGTAILISKPYSLTSSYKNNLSNTHHQITSKSDIENLAQSVFGKYFDHVNVIKKYQTKPNLNQAKQLTIVINILLKEGYDTDYITLDNNRIQYELERNSLLSYPYCVNIIPV